MTELSAKRRILSLWLPRLSTDRLQRQWAHAGVTDNRPLVLIAKVESAMRLSAVDVKAARQGLSPGMALADARAMIPVLAVHDADEKADARLLGHIADWCERYSPLVALDGNDGLLLDVTGVAHLFGPESHPPLEGGSKSALRVFRGGVISKTVHASPSPPPEICSREVRSQIIDPPARGG